MEFGRGLVVTGVLRLPPVLLEVHGRWTSRAPTAAVNEVLQEAQAERSAPGGARYRYGTQVSAGPPTFVIFGARPPHATYQRFFENRLRRAFHLDGVPIRLRFRQGQGRRSRAESTE
jgi:GTP-binding protein